jgi:hypothetical protein
MAKTSSESKTKRPKIDFEALNRWNSIFVVAYLLEAVALFVAATGKTFPVSLGFLSTDTLAPVVKGHAALVPATHHLFDISMVWTLIVLLLASAATHFLMASYLRAWYEKNLTKRANTIRWVGSGVTSGLALVAIGLLVGVQDIAALVMIFALGLAKGGLYATAELSRAKSPSTSTANFWIGTAATAVAWLVLGMYAIGAHLYGTASNATLQIMCWLVFALVAVSVANFYLQLQAKGKWADYIYGERIFAVTNFLAQSALVWLIFVGSLRP